MIVPGGRTANCNWIYVSVIAIAVALGFLLYLSMSRQAPTTPQKKPALHDPK